METAENCRICNAPTKLKWPSNLHQELGSDSFAITDAHYGQTSAIYECENCGFMQCNDLSDVLSYYEQLEDEAYENGRNERALQAEALLKHLAKDIPTGRLLDVGAGSGILVEVAQNLGYEAEGIEPSSWLQNRATRKGLPVLKGVLADIPEKKVFQLITVIDVIEHVEDPIPLLRQVHARLKENGLAMVVTPDCRSFFARLFGRHWWHYRVAHIGYFDQNTLLTAFTKTGFQVISKRRPGWYFTLDYLWIRLMQYLPRWMRIRSFSWMGNVTIPLNLRDSLLFIVKPKPTSDHGSR